MMRDGHRLRQHVRGVSAAVQGTLGSARSRAAGVLLTAWIFVLLVLSSFPMYSYQMAQANLLYVDDAVLALTANLYRTIGAAGLAATAVYAFLTAVAVIHVAIRSRRQGGSSVLTMGGTAPAFLIGGCAGCGAGILGLLGFAGAITLLPFQGNGLRLLGILFLTYFLGRAGDPRTCRIR